MHTEKKRLYYLDVLRVIGMCSIVFLHFSVPGWWQTDSSSWWGYNIFHSGTRWAVPLFFMISGALFLNTQREMPLKKLGLHMLKLILVFSVGKFLYGQLAFFTNPDFGSFSISNILRGFGDEMRNSQFTYQFWFLTALLALYMIVPLLRGFVKNASKQEIMFFLTLTILADTGLWVIIQYCPIAIFTQLAQQFSFTYVTGYIGVFVLGWCLSNWQLSKKTRIALYLTGGLCVLWVLLYSVYAAKNGGSTDALYSYTMLQNILPAAAVFTFVRQLCTDKEPLKIVSLLAKTAMGVYLLHTLFTQLIRITPNLWQMVYSHNGIWTVPVYGGLVVIVCSFFTLIWFQLVKWIQPKKQPTFAVSREE
ncbi:MAG: acyltransferase family protein [Oscillospiraceae bacterium]|nr:acyltransferase family protein [Oscillospiraceae bacterium]